MQTQIIQKLFKIFRMKLIISIFIRVWIDKRIVHHCANIILNLFLKFIITYFERSYKFV